MRDRPTPGHRNGLVVTLLVLVAAVLTVATRPTLATSLRQATPEAAATPVAVRVSNDLLGIFTVSIGKTDLPDGLAGGPALVGLWTVAFKGDGTYAVGRQDVGTVARGTYAVDGQTLTLNDWTGLIGCDDPTAVDTAATYSWQKQDDSLTLTPITENCTSRKILLSTRAFASYEACATVPLYGPGSLAGAATPEPSLLPLATPLPSVSGVAQQEGIAQGTSIEGSIDELLRQATGCWATQDPARFLPLHTQKVFEDLAVVGPLPDLARELKTFMATPVSFERIGKVNVIDETHVWAYVEITFGGEALPQRMDFAFENGQWLIDTFFLFGPPTTPLPGEPSPPGS